MNTRYLARIDYDRLKKAQDELIKHPEVGGPKAAAEVTRVDPARLSRYGSPHETTNAPVDVIADLEAKANAPIVTRILADLHDCDLVPRDRSLKQQSDYDEHATDLTRAACALMVKLQEARKDGIDAVELVQLESLAAQLQIEIAEFRRDAKRDLSAPVPMRRTGGAA